MGAAARLAGGYVMWAYIPGPCASTTREGAPGAFALHSDGIPRLFMEEGAMRTGVS